MAKKKSPSQLLIEFDSEEELKRLRRRDYRLKKTYDISQEDYEEIKEFQEHRCAICDTSGVDLVVDHDHGSGAVRGLLCSSCNVMLGHAKDNLITLSRAIDYLTEHRKLYCKPKSFSSATYSSPVPLGTVINYKEKQKKVTYESSKRYYSNISDECSSSSSN